MSIGILFESKEWSNTTISDILHEQGIDNTLINISDFINDTAFNFEHQLYWNRVFPSAEMRNNHQWLSIVNNFIFTLNELKIPVINSYKAFYFDFNKLAAYKILKEKGFDIPRTLGINSFEACKSSLETIGLPAVLKRNCGGRAWNLELINNKNHIKKLKRKFPLINDFWLVQEYIPLKYNYITRIELVNDEIICTLKRFLGSGNISSYSRGSSLKLYNDVPEEIIAAAKNALKILDIEMGSLDIIESKNGKNYIIDVNATTNFTDDYIDLLGFNPLEKMCEYVIKRYKKP